MRNNGVLGLWFLDSAARTSLPAFRFPLFLHSAFRIPNSAFDPVWLILKMPADPSWGENPFRFFVPPFALFGLMVIFYLGLTPWRHAWSAAMLLASLSSTSVLFLVAAFAR